MSQTPESPTVLVLVVDGVGKKTFDYLEKKGRRIRIPNLSQFSHYSLTEQASALADSSFGHRELMGVINPQSFELFYNGFSLEFISGIEETTGRKVRFNKRAGWSEVRDFIKEKGTSDEITAYASKCDPLIQLAMDEERIPVDEQKEFVRKIYDLAIKQRVPLTRVIGRAYEMNEEGVPIRTVNRKDKAPPLTEATLVDILNNGGIHTVGVGKISELVESDYNEEIKLLRKEQLDNYSDFKFLSPSDTNPYNIQGTINALLGARNDPKPNGTFIFSNLVDTDTVYGHTRDVQGAIRCIEEIDRKIPLLLQPMGRGDLIIVTADHGIEHGSDYGYHSKESIMIYAHRRGMSDLGGLKTGNGSTLAEVGHLAAQMFDCRETFLEECQLEDYF